MTDNPSTHPDTDSDDRLASLAETIGSAKQAARGLADHDVIDPDAVEGPVDASGDEVTGPADGSDTSGPDVPDSDPDD